MIHASGTEWKCRQKQLVLENEEEGENETLVEKSYDEEEKEKENPLNEKRVERSNDKENKNPPNKKPEKKYCIPFFPEQPTGYFQGVG